MCSFALAYGIRPRNSNNLKNYKDYGNSKTV